MQNCNFCGAGLPKQTHFCGYCGRTQLAQVETPTSFSDMPTGDLLTLDAPNILNQTKEPRTLLLDLLLPAALIEDSQAPAGNVPMVPGRPQASGAPTVPGAPLASNGPSAAQGVGVHHAAASVAHTLPSNQAFSTSPTQGGHATPRSHPPHRRRTNHKRYHRALRWGGAGLGGVVVITGFLAALLFFLHPVLSLIGDTTVISGGMLHLHGNGFIPSSSAFLTLDNGLPLSYAGHSATGEARYGREAVSATSLQIMIAGRLVQSSAKNSTVHVNSDGTFDDTIDVNPSWSVGLHTIEAREVVAGIGLRTAVLNFKIDPRPTTLIANPNSFNVPGDTNCSYNAHQGWACIASLSSSERAQGNLSWSVSSSGISGVTFNPPSGVLSPGQTAQVSIGIPSNTLCPAQADFMFKGSESTVSIQWNCATPTLTASASASSLSSGCLSCTVTLALAKESQGGLSWSASASGIAGVTFTPSQGKVFAGQPTQVTATVPNTTCPPRANFLFKGPANTAQFTWNCVPSKLAVSPAQFARTDCSYSQGWTCMASLTNQDILRPLNWSTSSSGIAGITFTPPKGTLPPSGRVSVTIFVPGRTCPASAIFVLMGSLNTIDVPWNCTLAILKANPASFNNPQDANCSYSPGQGWICAASVTNGDGQLGLGWSAAGSGITFSPASGTLPPGKTAQVIISVPDRTCPNNITFTFTSPANIVPVRWNCATPTLTVNPTSFNLQDNNNYCSYNYGWTCTTMLSSSSSNQGDLNWLASVGIGASGSILNPESGSLSPGQSVQMTVSIPSCPTGSILYSAISGTNPINVAWSC